MKGTLVKRDDGWEVKWSDLHSFGHGWHWMYTPIDPSMIIDETKLIDGADVEVELILLPETFNFIAKLLK
jgi:hypothetical protein